MIDYDFTTASRLSDAAHRAFDTISAIIALPDDSLDIAIAFRSLLIDRDDACDDCPNAAPHLDALRAALRDIDARLAYPHSDTTRQRFSMMLLDESLCPMHAIDYAICFDDDDDECAAIRAFFPIHDT